MNPLYSAHMSMPCFSSLNCLLLSCSLHALFSSSSPSCHHPYPEPDEAIFWWWNLFLGPWPQMSDGYASQQLKKKKKKHTQLTCDYRILKDRVQYEPVMAAYGFLLKLICKIMVSACRYHTRMSVKRALVQFKGIFLLKQPAILNFPCPNQLSLNKSYCIYSNKR